VALSDIARKIQDGNPLDEQERKVASKILLAFGQAYYENTGAMFISGISGSVDQNGMPEGVFICPTFGADWSSYYKRVLSTQTADKDQMHPSQPQQSILQAPLRDKVKSQARLSSRLKHKKSASPRRV
jgi:hypothetical protein